MPRMISMFLTQQQVKARTKTVTRRLGWRWLKPGTLLQPVVKAQGIPKGARVEKIGGLIEVASARIEPLNAITQRDVIAEGFGDLTPSEFVAMFCREMGCNPGTDVTGIEFRYL